MSSVFLGNNRQHMPVCAKTISSCIQKVLFIAKMHTSLGAVHGPMAFSALVAGVSLSAILQAGDWASVLTQLDTVFPHISLPQIGTRIPRSVLTLALVGDMLLVSVKP